MSGLSFLRGGSPQFGALAAPLITSLVLFTPSLIPRLESPTSLSFTATPQVRTMRFSRRTKLMLQPSLTRRIVIGVGGRPEWRLDQLSHLHLRTAPVPRIIY